MNAPRPEDLDSDSDDQDYVPPVDDGSDSDHEPAPKKPKLGSGETVEDRDAEARRRAELWSSFQASVSTPETSTSSSKPSKNMVKIEKKYRFAGEDVVEIKEVPEDSEDAKKWPLWLGSGVTPDLGASMSTPPPPPETSKGEPVLASSPIVSDSQSPPKPVGKRPGPRKPKTALAPLPTKAKKLTTLEKSAMDWRAHIESHPDSDMQGELEANRRGGGYLEKVEFMDRVGERRDSLLEAGKSGKRRR